jgi:hypothetical protein
VQQITAKSDSLKRVYGKLQLTQKEAGEITAWMEDRYYWGDVLTQLRGALIRSEDDIKKKLSAQKPGVEAGIWIEQLSSDTSLGTLSTGNSYLTPMMRGGRPPGIPGGMPPVTGANGTGQPAAGSVITLVCRAVNLSNVDPSANSEIAYAVENELKACPIFDPKTTQLTGQITPDDTSGTFTFGVTITLLNSLKL